MFKDVTPGDLLRWGRKSLAAAGIPNGNLDAKHLLLATLDLTPSELIAKDATRVKPDLRQAYIDAIQRRLARAPTSEILGYVDFYGLRFLSDHRALTPRIDSEIVVETALKLIAKKPNPFILDLGTGSGCLLLSILSQRPNATGVGIDASAAALTLALENSVALGLNSRVKWTEADWTVDPLPFAKADLVVSNPPYIVEDLISTLDPEVTDYDPIEALNGGSDGLNAYRQIIPLAAENIRTGVSLVLEIGYDQAETVKVLLVESGFSKVTVATDYAGNDRVVFAVAPAPQEPVSTP